MAPVASSGTTRRTREGLRPSLTDSAPRMPRCRVIDGAFDWNGDRQPAVPWRDTLHLRAARQGFHAAASGRAAGMARQISRRSRCPRSSTHLKSLGVTAVELMPVHAFTDEGFLHERGLTNYWGYNTMGWFAPTEPLRGQGSGGRAQAGGEGAARGRHRGDPRRGLQPHRRGQRARAHAELPRHRQPRLLLSSRERPALLRRRHRRAATRSPATIRSCRPTSSRRCGISPRNSASTDSASISRPCSAATARASIPTRRSSRRWRADPVLAYVKLIAEPWDVGLGGYQLGNFPAGWSEWNDRYRDTMRAFWHGGRRMLGGFAERFAGSSATCSAATAASPPRASTSSPRTTASRCATPCRTTSGTTRRISRTTATGIPTTTAGTAASKAPPTIAQIDRAAPPAGAQHADDAVLLAGRADAAGRRRAVSHAERQQQRVLPGQRDQLGRLERR